MTPIHGIFRDKRGTEEIVFETTGSSLTTTIRGVLFRGTDFDGLAPEVASDQFDYCHGDLCGCSLTLDIPSRLTAPDGLRHASIRAEIVLGLQGHRGGLDDETVQTSLTQPEFTVVSRGDSGWFEGELLSLAAQLPSGFALEACITCGLSDYSPYGHGCFGCMACFRDVADDYRRVNSKAGIFAIWDRLTDYVQETHYCHHYEPRPKGRGYRG